MVSLEDILLRADVVSLCPGKAHLVPICNDCIVGILLIDMRGLGLKWCL